jgi:alkylated DNA nucleotide flippase Atl1
MPYDPERHGPHRVVGHGFHRRVWSVVAQIPAGRVTTYGDVAAALGLRRVARQVGFALAALPPEQDDVPWHRVVTASGRLSLRADGRPSAEQARRLRAEGIAVDARGGIRGFARLRYRFPADGESALP